MIHYVSIPGHLNSTNSSCMFAGVWRWSMFLFRVIGWQLYRPLPPTSLDKFKTEDVTLIIPTIDTDEEAMHEAMRSWVLNEPYEILIITVGEHLQKELQHIASTSLAADITRVLYVEKPANKRIQLVHGAFAHLLLSLVHKMDLALFGVTHDHTFHCTCSSQFYCKDEEGVHI